MRLRDLVNSLKRLPLIYIGDAGKLLGVWQLGRIPGYSQCHLIGVWDLTSHGRHEMKIVDREGRNLLQIWKSQQRKVRAEFSAGNIAVWFTGYVESYSETELVLARGSNQVSVSLFCASSRVIEPDKMINGTNWRGISRVVVINTDANTACTLYELDC